MTEPVNRHLADCAVWTDPGPVAHPDDGCTCSDLRAEVARLREELEVERSRRTLGGVPPGYHEPGAWANQQLAPPDSASDPHAPPHHRRTA